MESVLRKFGHIWLLGFTIAFTYILMVFGNVVTTTGSGLACPDWPLCHGTVNPPKELSVWIEWGHRLLGALTGILITLSAIFIWKKAGAAMRFFIKLALGLMLAGVLLGGAVVLMEAPLLESVFHIALVSSHIVVSTIIFTSMIMALRALLPLDEGRGKYAIALFGAVYFQILLGIFVRYSNASLACPDFPLCRGGILPPDFSLEVLLHYTHRIVALGIFGLTLWHLSKNVKKSGSALKSGIITFALVCLQGTLGALIVKTGMFLPVVVMHGAVGFLLLGWVAYRAAPYIVSSADTALRSLAATGRCRTRKARFYLWF